MELYKKYRPGSFGEMFGNEGVVSAIGEKIAKGTLPHFMVFGGPPGCGKTTTARIIQKELGIGPMDFVEINAANQNGVEIAREIADRMMYAPVGGGKRLWLLDEAHKLTTACQQSMLKTLEDTPSYAYFIFASSEHEKLIPAIRSRATVFSFKPLDDGTMERLLRKVCHSERLRVGTDVIKMIISRSGGQPRNALVALDAVRDMDAERAEKAVEEALNAEKKAFDLLKALMWGRGGWAEIASVLADFNEDPEQTRRFILTAVCNRLKDSSKKDHAMCYQVAYSFRKPFYDNGMNDLIFACRDVYEQLNGK